MDSRARVSVRQCYYSVPGPVRRAPAAGAVVGDDASKSWTASTVVAVHERAIGRYVEVLALDHYLEVLQIKPGALPGATALAQAKARWGVHRRRTSGTGTRPAGPRATPAGTRALVEVLLAHRTLPAEALTAGDGPGRRPPGLLGPAGR